MLVLLVSAWHRHKAVFWKAPRKERWEFAYIFNKGVFSMKGFFTAGSPLINHKKKKRKEKKKKRAVS